MNDIEDRLRKLQTQREQESARRARSEVEEENATKAVAEVKAALKDEFGIVTSADLADVKSTLEAELEAKVAEAEQQLANA